MDVCFVVIYCSKNVSLQARSGGNDHISDAYEDRHVPRQKRNQSFSI